MSTFNSYLNKQMENPEFRAEYEALEPEFSIIQAMIWELVNTSGAGISLVGPTI